MIIASFLGFLLLFVLIGVLSVLKHKATTGDYLLAGRSVSPWLVSLSAVATNNSGYMFIGMIDFTLIKPDTVNTTPLALGFVKNLRIPVAWPRGLQKVLRQGPTYDASSQN